jgi:hypothetical protein
VGTYLGTKKVFNIGAGFYSQAEGTRSRVITGNDTMKFSVTEIVARPGEKLSVTASVSGSRGMSALSLDGEGSEDTPFIDLEKMMDDPNPIKEDELGTITHVGGGVINVSWDNGRKIGVVIGVDFYQILD